MRSCEIEPKSVLALKWILLAPTACALNCDWPDTLGNFVTCQVDDDEMRRAFGGELPADK